MPKIAILLAFFVVSIIFVPSVHADVNLLINEFLPRPSTGNPEWVEFYNTSSSSIDLSDYFFDDDTNFDSDSGSSAKVALSGILPVSQSCYWELSSYLNNNGDSPSLFKIGESAAVDTFTYTESQTDLSFARVPDGGQWQSNQSPTKPQTSCISLAPSPTPSPSSSSSSSQAQAPKSPSPSPKNSPSPSPKSSSPLPNQSSTVLGQKEQNSNQVLENLTSPSPTPSPSPSLSTPKVKVAAILMGSGVILIGLSAGFYLWYKRVLGAPDEENKEDNP